jgi:hypothetical protein
MEDFVTKGIRLAKVQLNQAISKYRKKLLAHGI